MADCTLIHATPPRPGAISILQLVGEVVPILTRLTGKADWPVGRLRLARFDDIDDGLAVRLTDSVAHLMPHGGVRIVQRLTWHLVGQGVRIGTAQQTSPRDLFPEAADEIEALVMAAVARACSPPAIDLLLDQPARWRTRPKLTPADEERSDRLNRLIDPPVVVLAGPANAGKSTLSNALLGRSMSIPHQDPGTTRDYTAARIDLAGLVVDWHDTPGLREAADPIERKAVDLAGRLMLRADLLVAIADAGTPWPDLPRTPDLRVGSKADLARRTDADLDVSALAGTGLADLVRAVRDLLVAPADLAHPGPWRFDRRLPGSD